MQDGEYGVVNKLKGKVAYIKLQSNPGSFHPIEADRVTYKGKHKGKDLYNESVVVESMIGIKTKANFKPLQLKGALEKAGMKGFQMNRLSVTLTALKLDKKYYNDAMKIIDGLGLAVMMAKESKIPAGHHKMPNGETMADEDHVDEANRGKVFRAAKKGSYPVTLVAIDNGKVVHQELARTPEVVPAAFNVLQVIIKKKHPNAKIRVEDNTGKLLFVEGKLNEMDMNDPILIAVRARKQMLAKEKSAPKTKKISTKQYYQLMDAEIDLIGQMKDATREYEQLDSDMNAEAGQRR